MIAAIGVATEVPPDWSVPFSDVGEECSPPLSDGCSPSGLGRWPSGLACGRQHYIAVNPLEAVKPPRKEAPKDDIDAVLVEGRRVMNAVQSGDDPDEARWLLAFLGLRRGERLGLPWRNVRGLDGDDPKLVIDQQLAWDKGPGLHVKAWPKNRKPRTIPLSEPWV